MVHAQVVQGTEEEIAAHLKRLKGRKNLLLIIPDDGTAPSLSDEDVYVTLRKHFYFTATPEEFQKAFNELGKGNEHLPVLPPEALTGRICMRNASNGVSC
jgi:hypothetical protein